jgi:hypothetical protein
MNKRNNPSGKTDPIRKKEEVQKSNDPHIDQDFENYPHHPAKENVVHPKTKEDLKIAGSGDVEEFSQVKPEEAGDTDKEIAHTGSGGAFEATEEVDHESDDKLKEKGRRNKKY